MGASGCSFLFADGPPPNHRELRYFDCNTSNIFPAADTLVGVLGLGYVIGQALPSPDIETPSGPAPGPPGPSVGSLVLKAIPFVVLPVTSAVYGYKKVGKCRDAKAELASRLTASP
jgi:hypothetical protein